MKERSAKCFIFLTAMCVLTLSALGFGQQQPPRLPPKARLPEMAVFDEAVPPQDQNALSERIAKNRRYNNANLSSLRNDDGKLTKNGQGTVISHSDGLPLPVFPFPQSALVVVGTVKSTQPYLSEDETSVYTEYKVQVEEVLRNLTGASLRAASEIIVDCTGGAIRLRSGKIVRDYVGERDMPRSDQRYLLFLRAAHDEKDLNIIIAFQLVNSIVKSLSWDDRTKIYDNHSESEFLAAVRQASRKEQ